MLSPLRTSSSVALTDVLSTVASKLRTDGTDMTAVATDGTIPWAESTAKLPVELPVRLAIRQILHATI